MSPLETWDVLRSTSTVQSCAPREVARGDKKFKKANERGVGALGEGTAPRPSCSFSPSAGTTETCCSGSYEEGDKKPETRELVTTASRDTSNLLMFSSSLDYTLNTYSSSTVCFTCTWPEDSKEYWIACSPMRPALAYELNQLRMKT